MRKACVLLGIVIGLTAVNSASAQGLRVGFAEQDITPKTDDPKKPVWLAGYGPGRQATGVHDPIYVRAMVLASGDEKIAIACADLVGLQYPAVKQIREKLAGYKYVLVSSTHNHEAPDVIGIWGKTLAHRGVDDDYLKLVVDKTVAAIRAAEEKLTPVSAAYGTAEDESLVNDSRQPIVKDGVLRALRFTDASKKTIGALADWSCHPEALGSRNKLITADFVAATVNTLKAKYDCPVVYLSGAVGGLMGPPRGRVKNAAGEELREGDFEYARVYGDLVSQLAIKAIDAAEPISLTPFSVASKPIAVPVSNPYYRAARAMGVLDRAATVWTGDAEKFGEPLTEKNADKPMAVESEVACLRLGELAIACIPGEIYPELVYGKYPAKAEAGVDFPDAELEPSVVGILPSKKWMLVGLANDEIGYIIPRRQWDNAAPFAYGRTSSQYGEINSCGADVAPVIMQALRRRMSEMSPGR